ncbi:MAG: response regulator transcription factor, partial [Comamonadaceae bacterium]
MRFLLVEDNIDLGEAIESKLRGAGHSVQWVCNGEAAIRWAGEGAWDALVLDINLPGKDGFAVIRELRAGGWDAPVLVITARAEIEDKIDMLDLGADD